MSFQNCMLPSGFKIVFVPTDEQIIRDYLFNEVNGNPLPSNEAIVDRCDLYDESDDWKKHFEERGENILYFFTTLKKKSENGSKIDRTTKCGATWKSQTEKRILDSQKQHIGSKKNLSFVPKNDDQVKEATTSWVMYEFRLDGILLNSANDSVVVCRVSKNVKNNKESKDNNSINNARQIMAPMVMVSSHHTLPSGYKILFDPSDEQIIRDHLFEKLRGNGLPSSEAIIECSLYDGCHVWRKQFEERGENMLYFFTELRRKSKKDSRVDRVTKCGTWKSQKDSEIHSSSSSSGSTGYNNEVHIGSRKNFSFVRKICCCDYHEQDVAGSTTTWVMHEYRLDGNVLKQYCTMNNQAECDYVICRIKRKVKNEEENNKNDNDEGPMVSTDNHVSRNMSEVELSDSYWRFAENLPNFISLSEDANFDYFDSNLSICLADLEDDDDKRAVNGMQEQHASASSNASAPAASAAGTEQDKPGHRKRFKADDGEAGSVVNRAKEINGLDYKSEETGLLGDLVRSCAYYCRDRGAAGS